MTEITEGNMIASYYQEEHDFDVIMIGDCELYENVSPMVLWDEYGINSFIRGSAQQLIWQSYYLLEDTLRYEKPKVVIFNVLAMKYNEPQSEAYNRMSLDGMRWSSSKVKAIKASMTEEESFVDYVFPLLRYHSRWSELKKEDIEYLGKQEAITHNGYFLRSDIRGVDPESVPKGKALGNYTFGNRSYEYLDKMVKLCKDNDIELILVKAPSLYPYWYDEWEEQIEVYAQENDLQYINYLELIDETGIDFSSDTYDNGLHLNVYGAEKMSHHLGAFLMQNSTLRSRRGEEHLEKRWDLKREAYELDQKMQLQTVEKNQDAKE